MIVINFKEARRHEELGHGSLYSKIQEKMASSCLLITTDGCLSIRNQSVLRHFESGSFKKLSSRLLQQRHYVESQEGAENECRPSLDRQEHQERLTTLTVSFAGKTTPCGVVKSLRNGCLKPLAYS